MVEVGAPQVVSGTLLERSRTLVARVNRFYAGVAASYYTRPELRAELLVNRVCCALQRYVPAGEWDDILSSLPRDLAALLPS